MNWLLPTPRRGQNSARRSLNHQPGRLIAMVLAMGLLAACQTEEERAAGFLERAQQHAAAGDYPRARIEYLNVLDLTPNDIDARFAFATLSEGAGERRVAIGHLLRIVEQDPDHVPSRKILAEMALETREWDEARVHLTRAAEVTPDDPFVEARLAVIAYADAAATPSLTALEAAHGRLLDVLPMGPDLVALHHAIVDGYTRTDQPVAALSAVDAGLAVDPGDVLLLMARLHLLNTLDLTEEVVPQLTRMIAAHPDRADFRKMLADWYIANDDLDAAEAVLSDMPDPGDTTAQLTLVRFLAEYRSRDVALSTLERLVAAHGRPTMLRLLRAAMAFEDADTEAALTEMYAAIAEAEERGEDTSDALYLLARMLDASGDRTTGETTLVTLLAEDPRHVAAAQLLAAWLLERGQPDGAILRLRAVLDVRPDDPKTLLLLARAHRAAGHEALTRQILARAFQASGNAAVPAMDYAALLVRDGSYASAIDVLSAALEVTPDHVGLLDRLGSLLVAQQDWARAEVVEGRLRVIGSAPARVLADRQEFQRLVAQGDGDTALRRLEARATRGDDSAQGLAILARASFAAADPALTGRLLELSLARFPNDPELRKVAAEWAARQGDYDAAATLYEGLVAQAPGVERLWTDYIAMRKAQGDNALILETVEAAIAMLPESPKLQWELALLKENTGQTAEAIAVYETLLAAFPQSAPVRNNLGALLSEVEDGGQSLARAAEIVEPLAGSPIPQFQSTYGWVRYQIGDVEAAVAPLIAAAEDLDRDPNVRLHAGLALSAAGRGDEARPHFRAVIDLAEATTPDVVAEAEAALAQLLAREAID